MSQTDTHHQLPTADVPKGTKLLIVRAPYYKQIGDDLLTGAEKAITDAGAAFETLDVPGALEIPTAKQAEVRANPKGQNKGGGAAEAALHLIAAKNRFGKSTQRRSIGFLPDSEHFDIA